jgi:carboxymethylenebutenolidase
MPSELIDVTTRDGIADAYLARPDGEGHPGVLLVVDAFGLRPQIERMADRISARGFAVLAPNVFYRASRLADRRRLPRARRGAGRLPRRRPRDRR